MAYARTKAPTAGRPGRALLGALLLLGAVMLLRSPVADDAAFVGATAGPSRGAASRIAMYARRFIIGGNWKANGTPDSVEQLISELNDGKVTVDTAKDVEVICAPPMVFLADVQGGLRKDYAVAAQNVWDKAPGAWTGEIPAQMLTDMGVDWVIIGHSERRENCGETNEVVAEKTKFAVEQGLKTLTCIGEKLEAREAGSTFDVLDEQMKPLAATLTEADWDSVVLAYEPVWAIGTGKVATPDQAEEVHAYLRKWLLENVSQKVSDSVRIQYGGSVNDKNSEELAKKPNIDGFLVGGASLQGESFTTIVNSASASVALSQPGGFMDFFR